MKNNVGVFYFQTPMPLHIFFNEDPGFERSEYPRTWSEIPAQYEVARQSRAGGRRRARARLHVRAWTLTT